MKACDSAFGSSLSVHSASPPWNFKYSRARVGRLGVFVALAYHWALEPDATADQPRVNNGTIVLLVIAGFSICTPGTGLPELFLH